MAGNLKVMKIPKYKNIGAKVFATLSNFSATKLVNLIQNRHFYEGAFNLKNRKDLEMLHVAFLMQNILLNLEQSSDSAWLSYTSHCASVCQSEILKNSATANGRRIIEEFR
jgi:hypothetical protein